MVTGSPLANRMKNRNVRFSGTWLRDSTYADMTASTVVTIVERPARYMLFQSGSERRLVHERAVVAERQGRDVDAPARVRVDRREHHPEERRREERAEDARAPTFAATPPADARG